MMSRTSIRRRGAIVLIGAILALGACASTPAETQPAVYTERGPHDVGVLTLSLSDRKVEVYYPAAAGAADGRTNDVYLQTDPVPPVLAGMLRNIPASIDLKVPVPAFRDAPAASGGAYPLVVFSHGAGGWRSGHGNLLSGIASWGFVVASVDFTEYGFASFASPGARDMASRRTASLTALDAALDLMAASNAEGPLKGLVDMSSIGAVGHSAGGGTMFAAIDNARIDTVVGWAPVPPQGPGAQPKPTMIVAADIDSGIPTASLVAAYEKLNAAKAPRHRSAHGPQRLQRFLPVDPGGQRPHLCGQTDGPARPRLPARPRAEWLPPRRPRHQDRLVDHPARHGRAPSLKPGRPRRICGNHHRPWSRLQGRHV